MQVSNKAEASEGSNEEEDNGDYSALEKEIDGEENHNRGDAEADGDAEIED